MLQHLCRLAYAFADLKTAAWLTNPMIDGFVNWVPQLVASHRKKDFGDMFAQSRLISLDPFLDSASLQSLLDMYRTNICNSAT